LALAQKASDRGSRVPVLQPAELDALTDLTHVANDGRLLLRRKLLQPQATLIVAVLGDLAEVEPLLRSRRIS